MYVYYIYIYTYIYYNICICICIYIHDIDPGIDPWIGSPSEAEVSFGATRDFVIQDKGNETQKWVEPPGEVNVHSVMLEDILWKTCTYRGTFIWNYMEL